MGRVISTLDYLSLPRLVLGYNFMLIIVLVMTRVFPFVQGEIIYWKIRFPGNFKFYPTLVQAYIVSYGSQDPVCFLRCLPLFNSRNFCTNFLLVFPLNFFYFLCTLSQVATHALDFLLSSLAQSQFSLAELSYKIGFRPPSQPPPLGSLQLDKFGSQGQMSLIGTLWVRLEHICIKCLDFKNTQYLISSYYTRIDTKKIRSIRINLGVPQKMVPNRKEMTNKF